MNYEIEESLEISQVNKSYNHKLVVENVTIKLKRGEIVGLFGPNGAGKTTCFYIMSGLIKPDHGQVMLNRADITKLPMYKRARLGVSYLPQESSIFRNLTVEENIMAIIEIIEPVAGERLKKLEKLLLEFGIETLRREKAFSLSGGERKKLEIAKIIATEPHFIIFDEPLAGIDPVSINKVKDLIFQLRDKNIGVFVTDHNVRDMLSIVDRAYIMYQGKILASGTPAIISENRQVRQVYLGTDFYL